MSEVRECDRNMWDVIRDLDTEREGLHAPIVVAMAREMWKQILALDEDMLMNGTDGAEERMHARIDAQRASAKPRPGGYLVPQDATRRILSTDVGRAWLYVQEHGRGLLR